MYQSQEVDLTDSRARSCFGRIDEGTTTDSVKGRARIGNDSHRRKDASTQMQMRRHARIDRCVRSVPQERTPTQDAKLGTWNSAGFRGSADCSRSAAFT